MKEEESREAVWNLLMRMNHTSAGDLGWTWSGWEPGAVSWGPATPCGWVARWSAWELTVLYLDSVMQRGRR